ncbi:hypothetical protein ZWY2020_042966 [Hordeum vulgare]|nr:hypothetical protein ZWY2020_042966 [Hordeum vulgare]
MMRRVRNTPAGPPAALARVRYSTQALLESRRVGPVAVARGLRLRGWVTWKQVACAAILLPGAVVFIGCAALSRREVVPYTNRAHWVVLSPSSERRVGDALWAGLKKRRGDMT